MIITIAGDPGSGKSTIGKRLAEKLNYEHYYIGQIRRNAAKKMGMTLAEYNKYGETHPETDIEVDEYQKKLGQEKDDFVIEGRTSWFLIPQSVKLYIAVEATEGAKRVFKELQADNSRNEDNGLKTIEDVLASHKKRELSDKLRYQKYYQKDCSDKNNFDFVVDTTNLTPDEVFKKVWKFIEKYQGKNESE